MLLYDNRGRLRLICQIYGSIYARVAGPVAGMVLYSVGLLYVRRMFNEYLPAVDHPFASQSFGTLIAFAVCFRTNIAWNRFWEACQEVTMMFSKWGDAFSQLQGFINSTVKMGKGDTELLEHYRCEITHMFTLLSAMAVERLSRGDIRRMEMRRRKGVAWKEQVVFRENLRSKDLTGSRNLIPIRVVKVKRARTSGCYSACLTEEDASDDGSEDEGSTPRRAAVVPSRTRMSVQLRQIKDSWQLPVSIIGELSKEELKKLRDSKDRINLVLLWLNELVTNLQPLIMVPPPILSRVYQELSNGTLGYSQAEKLSDIPFPFIFAQLLAVTIIFFATVAPIAFTVITGDSWITPVLSSGVVIAFWSLNEIAKELENPFGEDANNLPLVDAHERFVEFLVEMHGTTLPQDREYAPDQEYRTTVYSRDSHRPSESPPLLRPKSETSMSSGSMSTTSLGDAGGASPMARAAAHRHLMKRRSQEKAAEFFEPKQAATSSQNRVFPSTHSEQSANSNRLMLPIDSGGTPKQAPRQHDSSPGGMCSSLEHSNTLEQAQKVERAESLPQRFPDRSEDKQRDEELAGQAGKSSMTSILPHQAVADQAASTFAAATPQSIQLPEQDVSATSDQNSDLGVPPSDQCMSEQRLLS